MGKPKQPEPALLVMAIFSRYEEALEWAKEESARPWGRIELQSEYFPFEHTSYYQPQMGSGLKLQLIAFEKLINPSLLPEVKLVTNRLEKRYASKAAHQEIRPLNLDPGYLTLAKFVLATTKDASHRLYLGQGIFGEVTLTYRNEAWEHHEWTYPNYRNENYQRFFSDCRERLKKMK